ncbi:unnamed protein product [Prunus armeniaca]
MAAVMKGKESFAQAKISTSARGDGPKVDKPSSIWDACISDLLNTNFLLSSFACVGLVDHLRQVGDLGIFSSLSPLLAKFNAYREAAHESKSEVIVHAYKLGYLDCKRGDAPYHSIEDEDEDETKDDATKEAEVDAVEQVVEVDELVATAGEHAVTIDEQLTTTDE